MGGRLQSSHSQIREKQKDYAATSVALQAECAVMWASFTAERQTLKRLCAYENNNGL